MIHLLLLIKLLCNTGIPDNIAKEFQKLKDMISSVPGIVRPITEVQAGSHHLSRFTPAISCIEIPRKFQIPSMKLYDGNTDPEEHVAHYIERMEMNHIPTELQEACLCKGFGSTLTGPALKWLLSLPNNSISSFSHLINLFNRQFSCSRIFEKLTGDLYRVIQNTDESLRDYITRFSKESLEIRDLDTAAAVEAFKMGLKKDSLFYDDVVMTPCRNLDEVRSRALRFIRLEDDKKVHTRLAIPQYESTNRKAESPTKPKAKPYTRPDKFRINAIEDEEDDEIYPNISDYCFSVDAGGLMCAMRDLGEKARWPRKNEKQGSWRDNWGTRWRSTLMIWWSSPKELKII